MDRRRLARFSLIGAAALSASACAQQKPGIAPVAHSQSFAYTAADRECMARAMYFESNRSSEDGMLAVGTIVANRVLSGRYGTTVCQVVGAKRQFAPGVMTRTMSGASADLARATADKVLAGKRHVGAKSAMHFHTAGMRFPYPNMHYVLVAGGNAFYEKRDSGGGGRASNSRSLALALAHAKADSQPIQVAAATPLEHPLAPAVSTGGSVPVTAKTPGQATVTTQIAAARPAIVAPAQPRTVQVAAAPANAAPSAKVVPSQQPIAVASAAPVAARPVAAQRQQPVRMAARGVEPERSAAAPVAYAEAQAPAVVLPKVKAAPKRVVRADSEPALASIAPVSAKPALRPRVEPKAAAKAKQEVETEQQAAAPEAAPAVSPTAAPNASSHVASAFEAFR